MPFVVDNPGTGSSVQKFSTDVAWTTPGNIVGNNTNYASVDLTTTNSESEYLVATNFGFDISQLADLEGMIVEVDRISDQDRSIQDDAIQIWKSGTVDGTNESIGTYWTNSWTTDYFGSASDKWGILGGENAAYVNASDFGVAFRCQFGDVYASLVTAQIRRVEVTIYYSIGDVLHYTTKLAGVYHGTNSIKAIYHGSTKIAPYNDP